MDNDDLIRLLGPDYVDADAKAAERLIAAEGEPSDEQWPDWLRRVAILSGQIRRGSVKTPRKAAASRENGRKGGRPKRKK